MTNGQIPVSEPPEKCTQYSLVLQFQSSSRYSQPPSKGLGKKASKQNNTQPSISAIFTQTSSFPQSRNLGTGCLKLFCTACGEYDHWRKDCPYDCHCDNCDSDSHATHMCRAPPKPSPTPSPQPVILYLLLVVQIIGQWSAVTILEITERKVVHPAQHQTGTTEINNKNLPGSPAKISQKSNGKSRNNDKPRTSGKNPQRS